MSELDLDTIRARCEAATPGPWDPAEALAALFARGTLEDAAFVAHAREDVPALLARVDELEATVAQAGAAIAGIGRERDALRAAVEKAHGYLEVWANSPDDLRGNIARALAVLGKDGGQ